MKLTALLFCVPLCVCAQVPVDVYVDFEAGSDGDTLTAELYEDCIHGSVGTVSVSGDFVKRIETNAEQSLRSSVNVGGATYSDATGSRGASFQNQVTNYARFNFAQTPETVSMGCYISFGSIGESALTVDYIQIGTLSGHFLVAQTDGGFMLAAHGGVEVRGPEFQVLPNTWYWITMQFVMGANCRLALYSADTWDLIGVSDIDSDATLGVRFISIGRVDNHGGAQPPETSYNLFDDLLIDSSNATFPLLPLNRRMTVTGNARVNGTLRGAQ